MQRKKNVRRAKYVATTVFASVKTGDAMGIVIAKTDQMNLDVVSRLSEFFVVKRLF